MCAQTAVSLYTSAFDHVEYGRTPCLKWTDVVENCGAEGKVVFMRAFDVISTRLAVLT